MDKQNDILCPSSTCTDGSYLLGIVKKNGEVAIASGKIKVDSEFVRIAKLGRKPEKRFRFANNCVTTKCEQWQQGRCSVIDKVIDTLSPKEIPEELPKCSIRADCRWYKQCGGRACVVCPEVITDLS
jgi:hypothetical protein